MTNSSPHTPADVSRAGAEAARRSLEGLSLGDAFGERWFPSSANAARHSARSPNA